MQEITLKNGVKMPSPVTGTAVCGIPGQEKILNRKMTEAIAYGISIGITNIDMARDYGNEKLLGGVLCQITKGRASSREHLFLSTKVGNGQQRQGNMKEQLERSLSNLQLDYLDLWFLHWPLPDYYINNWIQMLDIYNHGDGKVRALGIANCEIRHLKAIEDAGLPLPHVMQTEFHPFCNSRDLLGYCKDHGIQLEACTSTGCMWEMVRECDLLKELSEKYKKSIAQIIMRWHYQNGVIPIFRSFNPVHIKENIDIYDFELTDKEMDSIWDLNIDYRVNPASLNCPGY